MTGRDDARDELQQPRAARPRAARPAMKKPKCRFACTPAAAPNIMVVLMQSNASGSVQLGESFST